MTVTTRFRPGDQIASTADVQIQTSPRLYIVEDVEPATLERSERIVIHGLSGWHHAYHYTLVVRTPASMADAVPTTVTIPGPIAYRRPSPDGRYYNYVGSDADGLDDSWEPLYLAYTTGAQ